MYVLRKGCGDLVVQRCPPNKYKYFSDIVKAFLNIAGWDETTKTVATPSFGIKIGQLLGKIALILKGEAIITKDSVLRSYADDVIALIELRWNDEISRISRKELETRKWNKLLLLPLVEDLQVLKKHIIIVQSDSLTA